MHAQKAGVYAAYAKGDQKFVRGPLSKISIRIMCSKCNFWTTTRYATQYLLAAEKKPQV